LQKTAPRHSNPASWTSTFLGGSATAVVGFVYKAFRVYIYIYLSTLSLVQGLYMSKDIISQKYGKMVTNKTRTEKKLGLSIAIYSPDIGTYFSTHDWEALQ